MQMIGSRAKSRIALEQKADFRLDLRGADLPTAQFLGADLSNAMFHNSNLSGANFANTDLTDSFLSYSDLSQAQFHNVTFTRTRLCSANLSGAMLQEADLSWTSFHNANPSGRISSEPIYPRRSFKMQKHPTRGLNGQTCLAQASCGQTCPAHGL